MNLSLIVEIANIIIGLGVFVAITQININRKQLHLSTIKRCIDEFRYFEDKRTSNTPTDVRWYIDLVNEELFYFQHKYLPKVIAYEWLDGMIDYIPIVDSNGIILNKGYCLKLLEENRNTYLKNYPRLKDTFLIRQSFNFSIIYDENLEAQELRIITRKKIVEELYFNVINFSF